MGRCEEKYLGYKIRAKIEYLDKGVYILLIGGSKTHIGAIGCKSEKEEHCYECKGHKEGELVKKWMEEIFFECNIPVSVCCGIHFDDLNRKQITEILNITDRLLKKTIKEIRRMYYEI
jgi:uncharacterized protein YqfB (UPF0267 family)